LVVLFGALAAGIVRWWGTEAQRAPNELRIAHLYDRFSLDPRVMRSPSVLERRVIDALWDPLIGQGPRGEPLPAAAEAWTLADDGQRITFHLRAGLQWSNGDQVTAADFVRALEWSAGFSDPHPLLNMLHLAGDIEGATATPGQIARAIDERTLEVTVAHPLYPLLDAIAASSWKPLHATNAAVLSSGEYLRRPASLVTNGAFVLNEVKGDSWQLVRNARFRDADSVALASVRLIGTESTFDYTTLLRAGRVDLTDVMPYFPQRQRAAATAGWLRVENMPAVSMLHFNLHKPPLNDPRVRRALSLALDREALARELTGGGGQGALSSLPVAANFPGVRTVAEDLAEARRLLAEAGFPGGKGMPTLRLPLVETMLPNPMAYLCADQWRARLGIAVYVIPLPGAEIFSRLTHGEFDLMHYYWTTSSLQPSVVATEPYGGLPRAFRPELREPTQALLRAARESPVEQRAAAMRAAEESMLQDMPCTPVVFYRRSYFLSERVQGWTDELSGAHPFAELSLHPAPAP
jgi:oligopeptide transport system substrate-binding protein